jgi:hypothetical protein
MTKEVNDTLLHNNEWSAPSVGWKRGAFREDLKLFCIVYEVF